MFRRAPAPHGGQDHLWLFQTFSRTEWAAFGADEFDLTPEAIVPLIGINERISLSEAREVFGPLSRLLNLRRDAEHRAAVAAERVLYGPALGVPPFIVAIAGSVAVGKSTFARILRSVLAQGPTPPTVELVATDGFLFPGNTLLRRGLMARKGFPETYDLGRMLRFLCDLKAGEPVLNVPVYSHESYDIVAGEFQMIRQPDILILEGLNVLQTAGAAMAASDFIDFGIYIDADPEVIETWYVNRFAFLQATVFQRPTSYFHHYRDLLPNETRMVARDIWQSTNLPNLIRNIRPTRERADLVICKGESHAVESVWLRRQFRRRSNASYSGHPVVVTDGSSLANSHR